MHRGARNMALVRHFIIDLLRHTADSLGARTRCKTVGWDPDSMRSMLAPAGRLHGLLAL